MGLYHRESNLWVYSIVATSPLFSFNSYIIPAPMFQLQEYHDISHLSWYHTRAQARYFFKVKTRSDIWYLREVYAFAWEKKLPFFILWSGLNCLFAFDIFPWVIVKNGLTSWKYDTELKYLIAESQAGIWDIAEILEEKYDNSLWHRFIGLPWSIWGAIYGNAWCFWLETENNFVSARILDLTTGEQKIWSPHEMHFSYRSSALKEKYEHSKTQQYCILEATFDLSKKVEKYHSDADVRLFRETKQPKGNTCGSFFKNPSKELSAGSLIESVGLRWFHLGTGYFSDVHANFLMSEEGGSWRDLLSLVDLAQKKVYDQFGIVLVPEVQILSS